MDQKIPIIMLVDVEPDGFFIDRTKALPWKGYEAAYELFSGLRPRLENATGSKVHFSWFYRLDPQVAETYGSFEWPITHYPKFAESFLRHGDDLGLHPHVYRWSNQINNWIEDQADQEWVNYCVEMGFKTYGKLFGLNCESFRFGAYWINNETLKLAECLGARFDLTIEPGYGLNKLVSSFSKKFYSGTVPDFEMVPQIPYQPSQEDFRKPDSNRNNGLWVIPLSTGNVQARFGRVETFYKKIFSPHELEPKTITLNLARGTNGFRIVMDNLLKNLQRPYLTFIVRSDVSHEPQDPSHKENMNKNIEYILNHPLVDRFVFTTPAEAMDKMGYLNISRNGGLINNVSESCGSRTELEPKSADVCLS